MSIFSVVLLLDLYFCRIHLFPLNFKLVICKVGVKVNLISWNCGGFSDLLRTCLLGTVLNTPGKKTLALL